MEPDCSQNFGKPDDLKKHHASDHGRNDVYVEFRCLYPDCNDRLYCWKEPVWFRKHLLDVHEMVIYDAEQHRASHPNVADNSCPTYLDAEDAHGSRQRSGLAPSSSSEPVKMISGRSGPLKIAAQVKKELIPLVQKNPAWRTYSYLFEDPFAQLPLADAPLTPKPPEFCRYRGPDRAS